MKKIILSILLLPVALAPANRPLDLFEMASAKYKVPVRLIRGIAYAETGAWIGRPVRLKIRSSSGAIGIMQIMPKTGAYHCPGKNLENVKQNIECGALYIAWLRVNYCRSDYCVAASYLNGPNAVRHGRISRQTKKYWKRVRIGYYVSKI